MFQFFPSCSADCIRVSADMRILPSAVTNISLKTRKIILDGIKRPTEETMHYVTNTILSKKSQIQVFSLPQVHDELRASFKYFP